MRVHRYTDRFGRASHSVEVRVPSWAWRLLTRSGAERDQMELVAERTRGFKLDPSAERIDYWAATEAPRAS